MFQNKDRVTKICIPKIRTSFVQKSSYIIALIIINMYNQNMYVVVPVIDHAFSRSKSQNY